MNNDSEYITQNGYLYKYDENKRGYIPVLKIPLSDFSISKERAIELYEHSLAVKEETQCTQD